MKTPEQCFKCLKDRAKANVAAVRNRMGSKWTTDAENALSDCSTETELRITYARLANECTHRRKDILLASLPCEGIQAALIV